MENSFDFDYDLWANQKWLQTLPEFPDQGPVEKILVHILFAQWAWLRRGVVATKADIPVPAEPLAASPEAFNAFHQAWKNLASGHPASTLIAYSNFQGTPFQNTLGEITAHVLNHGTYHRGQLRALAGEQNVVFPETDFIAYARLKNEA